MHDYRSPGKVDAKSIKLKANNASNDKSSIDRRIPVHSSVESQNRHEYN